MQFSALVHAPAAEVFDALYNPVERSKWDAYVTHGKVVEDRKGKTNTQVPLEESSRTAAAVAVVSLSPLHPDSQFGNANSDGGTS